MGGVWLGSLPQVLRDAGLNVSTWDGWEHRSRSSGGYNEVRAIGIHHDANKTGTPLENRCRAAWDSTSNPNRPVGAIWLHTDARVVVGAAGATNTQGKGGPYSTSKGTIPQDQGNLYMLSIEASNNGVGEVWPVVQLDAYVTMCAALCDWLGLDPARDVVAHFEWSPGRKIDPAGPPRYAVGGASWNMGQFRGDVAASTPDPTPDPGDTDMASTKLVLCDVRGTKPAYLCDANTKTWINDGHAMEQILMRLEESKGGTVASPVDGFVYKRLDHGGDDVIASYGPIVGAIPPGFDKYGKQL